MNLRLLRTYYLLEDKIRRKGIASSLTPLMATIPPEDRAQVQQYVETIAAILIRTTALEYLRTYSDIEQTLSRHTQLTGFPALIINLIKHQIHKQRMQAPSAEQSVFIPELLVS
ncbi:hypothetical protein C7271_10325 [filamentous cyanobacterium CCP5]|nr:hypothetical protein C7271_10325 [filamentous cyanobacterium CCP5]